MIWFAAVNYAIAALMVWVGWREWQRRGWDRGWRNDLAWTVTILALNVAAGTANIRHVEEARSYWHPVPTVAP